MTSKLTFSRNIVALSSAYPRALLVAVFLLGVTAVTWRFGAWMPAVFFGDDLSNLLHYRDGSFPRGLSEAISVAFVEKYRPVFVWLMSVMFGALDDRLWLYLAVNVLLHGVNATLVFAIARRLSHGNWIVSLAVTLAAATSRFALYQVTQVTGFLEGIALTLFLLMTYCMVRASDEDKEAAWRWSWLAIFTAFLAINTHERYIVVAPWLCLALLAIPSTRALPRGRLFTLLGACVAIGLSNALLKVAILKMPFFVGTGGTHMDLDLVRVVMLVMQAVLSIFGFNEGPEYLVGVRAISLDWFPVWLLAAVIAFAWLIAIIAGVRAVLGEKVTTSAFWWQPLYWPLLLAVLGAFMLMPPALTIRMEQRWVLAPFIIMLLMFAWAAGVQRHRAAVPVWILAVAVGFGTVVSDSFFARHFDPIFFATSGRFATIVKRDIVDEDPGQSAPLALIANADHCNWTLIGGEFFRVYGDTPRAVSCFVSAEEAKAAALAESTPIYGLASSPLSLMDVRAELLTLIPNNEKVTHDFLALFPTGNINDPREMQSPSGKGAMMMPWDSFLGQRNTLTLVSGFSYSYDAVTIEPNSYLRFGITMLYPSQESARAIVRFTEDGVEPRTVYSQDLMPPLAGEQLQFEPINISLADFANKNGSITFILETAPGKNNSGHWAAFAEPRIVIDTAR